MEVESFFVSTGSLVPGAYPAYYMGLRAAVRPFFNWLEPSVISPWKLDGGLAGQAAACWVLQHNAAAIVVLRPAGILAVYKVHPASAGIMH